MASYQQEREEFAAAMAREFAELSPYAVVQKAARIVRDSNRIQAHAVNLCNREVTAREVNCARRAEERIRAEFGSAYPADAFQFSGDPRGACAKVRMVFVAGNDGGGEGFYCIPSRNY